MNLWTPNTLKLSMQCMFASLFAPVSRGPCCTQRGLQSCICALGRCKRADRAACVSVLGAAVTRQTF